MNFCLKEVFKLGSHVPTHNLIFRFRSHFRRAPVCIEEIKQTEGIKITLRFFTTLSLLYGFPGMFSEIN